MAVDYGFEKIEYTEADSDEHKLSTALDNLNLLPGQIAKLRNESTVLQKKLDEAEKRNEIIDFYTNKIDMMDYEIKEKSFKYKDLIFVESICGGWKFKKSSNLKQFLEKQVDLVSWEKEMYYTGHQFFQLRNDNSFSSHSELPNAKTQNMFFTQLSVPQMFGQLIRHSYVINSNILKIVTRNLLGGQMEESVTLRKDGLLEMTTNRLGSKTTRTFERLPEYLPIMRAIEGEWRSTCKKEIIEYEIKEKTLYRRTESDDKFLLFCTPGKIMNISGKLYKTFITDDNRLTILLIDIMSGKELKKWEWYFKRDTLLESYYEQEGLTITRRYERINDNPIEWC